MKFWELTSVCREEPHLLERLAEREEWRVYLDWVRDIKRIVNRQDRAKLDAELPDEACVHVLEASGLRFSLAGDYLWAGRSDPSDIELSAVEAFQRFGGRALEDALEYTNVRVK